MARICSVARMLCGTWGVSLACARYRPARILGDLERAFATRGLHAVSSGIGCPYRHLLRSLPETIGFEVCCGPGVRVLLGVVQLLRRGRHAQLRHGGGVLRLVLLTDVIGYRDGAEYPDYNDDRIAIKTQTQESLGFVPYSLRAASTG